MQIRSVGIDLGKTTFHLVALGDNGKVLLKKKFTQKQLIAFTANMQTCLIGMEACSGSHFLGRALRAHGAKNCSDQPDSCVSAGAGHRVRQEPDSAEGSSA